MVTNVNFHLDNHFAWFGILKTVSQKFKSIKGITLTGWQRYDHYAVLCELFPEGLPSLAVCLKFIQQGSLTSEDVKSVSQDLEFTSALPFDPMSCTWIPSCTFPGSAVYQLVIELCHLHRACNFFFSVDGISGWMNDYNVHRGHINPVHIEPLHARAESLLQSCLCVDERLGPAFSDVFAPGVLEEWRGCFVVPLLSKLEHFLAKAKAFVAHG